MGVVYVMAGPICSAFEIKNMVFFLYEICVKSNMYYVPSQVYGINDINNLSLLGSSNGLDFVCLS